MKIFRTVSSDVMRECRLWFGILDIKVLVVKHREKFLIIFVLIFVCCFSTAVFMVK